MLKGLVSVTFRKLEVEEIIKLTKKAGLDGIEWGSDIHCPPGEFSHARYIADLMADAGLETISYGSYYRIGTFESFDDYVKTACELETDNIRVWAGSLGSDAATGKDWSNAVEDSKRIAGLAGDYGIKISFEYHCDTLTDSIDSTLRLLTEIDTGNVFSYWQPPVDLSIDENIDAIAKLVSAGKLMNLHVSSWEETPAGVVKCPLAVRGNEWKSYINEASSGVNALLLEFVKDDDPEIFLKDSAYLMEMLKEM